jgi:cytochrome P450
VADLLGVPEADHQRFKEFFGLSVTPGEVGAGEQGEADLNPLAGLDEWFARYVEDRRREPRQDVLTQLALATYPDGTTPQVSAVVRTATFLFAAGQETTARRSTSIAGVDVAAGPPVMLLNGAANRDPGRFECPQRHHRQHHPPEPRRHPDGPAGRSRRRLPRCRRHRPHGPPRPSGHPGRHRRGLLLPLLRRRQLHHGQVIGVNGGMCI